MSPEKSRVVLLCIEFDQRDKWCASIRECQRQCYFTWKGFEAVKAEARARQNLVPKARTKSKKELAQRKADEEQLAAYRKEYHDCEIEWRVQNAYSVDVTERYAFARIARLERLLRDAGGEW